MATHSSVLALRIPGMAEPGGCRLWGCTESDTTEVTLQHGKVWGLAACLPKANKQARLMKRKVCFISDTSHWKGEGSCMSKGQLLSLTITGQEIL